MTGPSWNCNDVEAVLATSANGIRALVRRTAAARSFHFRGGAADHRRGAARAVSPRSKMPMAMPRHLAEAATRWAEPRKGVLLHVCGTDAPGTLAENLTLRGFQGPALSSLRHRTGGQPAGRSAQGAAKTGRWMRRCSSRPAARAFSAYWPMATLPTKALIALVHQPGHRPGADGLLSFAQVAVAARPNQAAMLALADQFAKNSFNFSDTILDCAAVPASGPRGTDGPAGCVMWRLPHHFTACMCVIRK